MIDQLYSTRVCGTQANQMVRSFPCQNSEGAWDTTYWQVDRQILLILVLHIRSTYAKYERFFPHALKCHIYFTIKLQAPLIKIVILAIVIKISNLHVVSHWIKQKTAVVMHQESMQMNCKTYLRSFFHVFFLFHTLKKKIKTIKSSNIKITWGISFKGLWRLMLLSLSSQTSTLHRRIHENIILQFSRRMCCHIIQNI